MNILFLDFELPYLINNEKKSVGGACVRQYAFLKGLEKIQKTNNYVLIRDDSPYIEEKEPGIHFFRLPFKKSVKKLEWLYYFFSIRKKIKKLNPDVIITKAAGFTTGIFAILAFLLSKPHIYFATNNIDFDNRVFKRLDIVGYIFYKIGLMLTKAVVCQNQYQYDTLKNKYPNKKAIIIHNPFYYRGELPKVKTFHERNYIAWLATFSYRKNMHELIKITQAMPHINFKIAGGGGDMKIKDRKNIISQLKQLKNVELTGYLDRSKIIPFLSKAYCLLNTSYYEGFSNTFLESFAAGTPVITFQENDPDNIITTHDIGYTYSTFYDALNKLQKVIDKDASFDDMAYKCQNYIIKNHNYIEKSKELYNFLNSKT